jgi:hypothetical protein
MQVCGQSAQHPALPRTLATTSTGATGIPRAIRTSVKGAYDAKDLRGIASAAQWMRKLTPEAPDEDFQSPRIAVSASHARRALVV